MKKGLGIFGKQYEIMYKNDVHAKGSVDRVLTEEMIKLDKNSAGYLYTAYTGLYNSYIAGSRIVLENIVTELKRQTEADTVDAIISYCKNIVDNCNYETEDMIFGGTEEEIIERGTYWCTDIARVACVMLQIAGLPSRIVITADTRFAYSGHVVTEVCYNSEWGVCDPTSGKVFRDENGVPISAWKMHSCRVDEQYESVAVSNYFVNDKEKYSYETSTVNDYYRGILKHSSEQWAGGIRWIHGEDLV